MSKMYRGKEIFKPLNTGWIDEHVACVREWAANIFFYRKGDRIIMIDAGYNYDRLEEKMGWLGIDPKAIRHILITHQDTDHVGAVEADSPGLFKNAALYIGETENRYLTGHTGWTDNFEFAFAHKTELCSSFKKMVHDPSAPFDAYDESDDTEESAKAGFLKGVGR